MYIYIWVRSIFIGRYLPAYEDGTECSETSAYKIQTPGIYPEESIQHLHIFLIKSLLAVREIQSTYHTHCVLGTCRVFANTL